MMKNIFRSWKFVGRTITEPSKLFFLQMAEKRKRSFVLAYSQKQPRFPFLIFMPSIPALTNEH